MAGRPKKPAIPERFKFYPVAGKDRSIRSAEQITQPQHPRAELRRKRALEKESAQRAAGSDSEQSSEEDPPARRRERRDVWQADYETRYRAWISKEP